MSERTSFMTRSIAGAACCPYWVIAESMRCLAVSRFITYPLSQGRGHPSERSKVCISGTRSRPPLIVRKSRHRCRLAARVWPPPAFSTQSTHAQALSGRLRATGPVALRRGDAPPLLQSCRLPEESYGRDRTALEILWDSWSPSVETRRCP